MTHEISPEIFKFLSFNGKEGGSKRSWKKTLACRRNARRPRPGARGPRIKVQKTTNAIFVISPYRHHGVWVFDDSLRGLEREPFVAGIDRIIDRLAESVPNAEKGFRLIFSPTKFPSHTIRLEWRREEHGGNWYYSPQFDMEGWLCPALFKYFDIAPRELYGRAEPKED